MCVAARNRKILGGLKSFKVIRRLSWSISSNFVAIHSGNVRCNQKLLKKITKKPFFGESARFTVVQGHRCW